MIGVTLAPAESLNATRLAHADRRLAEARKFGLGEVIEPSRHAVIRRAVGFALGRGERTPVAA